MSLRSLRAFAGLGARAMRVGLGSGTNPFKVTLALTERCDCRCEACWIWRKPKGREMTPDEVGGFLSAAPSVRWLNLTGGEPFLRSDVPEVAEAAWRALPRLAVLDFPTTGQRTDAIVEAVERIARLGIPRVYVTVSVDGPPEIHDALRGRPGAFENAVRTFARLRRVRGARAWIGMTLSDRNAHAVEETLAAVAARVPGTGWRDLHLNVFTTSSHYYDNVGSGVGRPADVRRAVAAALRAREGSWSPVDRVEAAYLRLLPRHLETGRSPIRCRSGSAGVFVSASGDVYPCTVWDRRLGNVLERPLPEILAAEQARAVRAAIARDKCPGCWSPCEANPTILATAPASLFAR